MKAITRATVADQLKPRQVVDGRIARVADFGVFVSCCPASTVRARERAAARRAVGDEGVARRACAEVR